MSSQPGNLGICYERRYTSSSIGAGGCTVLCSTVVTAHCKDKYIDIEYKKDLVFKFNKY